MKDFLLVKSSSIHGKGLFTNKNFEKDDIVVSWKVKKLFNQDQLDALGDDVKQYVSKLKDGEYALIGEPACYVNHSCDPNTQSVNGKDIAIRPIQKGEEITTDYSKEAALFGFQCFCGSEKCRKVIGKQLG